MKPVQCKCADKSTARRTLIKWLKDPKLSSVGLDKTDSGYLVHAMRQLPAKIVRGAA